MQQRARRQYTSLQQSNKNHTSQQQPNTHNLGLSRNIL